MFILTQTANDALAFCQGYSQEILIKILGQIPKGDPKQILQSFAASWFILGRQSMRQEIESIIGRGIQADLKERQKAGA